MAYDWSGAPATDSPSVDVVGKVGSGVSSWFSDFKINPSTGPILSTFGAITGAIGSYYQAQAMANNLEFQADMAKINANIAETNAQATLLAGQRAQQNVRLRTAHLKSSQRVGMAANGIDLGSKTAVNVLTSTDYMGEIDAQTVEQNAIRAAFGYRTQSVNDQNVARLTSATSESINPYGVAGSALLANAGQVASNWYKYSKERT